MSKESLHSIISSAISNNKEPIHLLEVMRDLLGVYEEEELVVTPNTRCEFLLDVLDVTNPELDEYDRSYITNAILHDKGIIKSIESLNDYANVTIRTMTSGGGVSVVIDKIEVNDSTNLFRKIEDLINELIFTLDLSIKITLIVHKIKTSVEVIDVVGNIHQTRLIRVGPQ